MPEQTKSLSPSVARFLDTSRRYFGLAVTQKPVGRGGLNKGSRFGGSLAGHQASVPLAAKS